MVHCPNCKTDNRQGANFCKRCGALLASSCPRCATPLPDAALFCDHCGLRLLEPAAVSWQPAPAPAAPQRAPVEEAADEPLAPPPLTHQAALQQFIPAELMARLEAAAERGTMVGERRIVTILFCDTVGSTAAAEQLDPEEWTEIINGAFEQMIRPIYRYEGTVARLMGDGLLAFFGAPIAHEDDPQRAVLAGLDIVQEIAAYARDVKARWGIAFDVRVGINTGMVVVGSVGSDLRMEYTAIGDAINLAARMEQTAAPGTVQLAQETYRSVEPLFEFESLGAIAVKGKEAPVTAYRVLGAKRQPGRRRGLVGLQAPLLGRDAELARLRQAVQRAGQGVGHIALLVGEAGLGKSRLVEELRLLQSSAPVIRWYEAGGASHEAGQPFALLRGMLRAIGGWQSSAPRELHNSLLGFVTDEDKEELAAVLHVLLGVDQNGAGPPPEEAPPAAAPLSGEAFRRRLAAAVNGLLTAVVGQTPTVLVLDDLHWADAASVDLLLQLLPLTGSVPLFLLCAMRPERQSPGWRIREEAEATYPHRSTIINIRPLQGDESRRLVESFLGNGRLPQQLPQLILDKAEGNPYFVEEVIRSLVERGLLQAGEEGLRWSGDGAAGQIVIPDSLQSLLTARIDRLEEETRYTLQLASVIGRSFYYRVLEKVSARRGALLGQLDDLQRRTVIREAARLPELEYVFHQALMQEAAYRSILRSQRRTYHLHVAEAIEQLFPDRLEEFALPLGRHFYEAGDERALRYYRMAGDAATRVFANAEAADHYAMAIECGRQGASAPVASDDDLLYLYRRRGRALELNSRYEDALHNYQQLMVVAQERGSPALELAALIGQATQRLTANPVTDYDEGQALVEKALPLALELNDRAAEATIMWQQVLLLIFDGDREKQLAYGERGLMLARELGMKELEGFILHDMWYVYGGLGQWQKMAVSLQEACALWVELGNLPMLAASLTRLHFAQVAGGQYEQALQSADEAFALSVEGRDPESQALSHALLGLVHLERGRPDLAMPIMKENIAIAEPIGNVTVLGTGPAYLGWAHALLGDFDNAVALARQAVDFSTSNFPLIAVMPQAILVRVLLMKGDLEAARLAFASMEDYETARRRIGFFAAAWLMAMLATGEIALAEGEAEQALAIAEDFVTSASEGDLHFLLPDALLLQGRALAVQGRSAEARQALEAGLAEAEALGSQRSLWPILVALADQAAANDDPARAKALKLRAEEVVQSIAAHAGSDALRASFLRQAAVASTAP